MSAPASVSPRSFWIVPLIAAAGALLYCWQSWCAFTDVTWNELRLAPAFALRQGLPLYPPLGGGPLSTWIYGPVGAIVNLPATLANSTIGALQVAGVINLLTLAGPLAVVFFGSAELRDRGWPARILALALGVLLLPHLSIVYQVADHTATALGLLSCWCLAQTKSPNVARTGTAAALVVLSIWAKQTSVFLVPAHVVYLLMARERRAAGRYLAWIVALGLLSGIACVAAFGFDNLRLNLVEIPARLPWAGFREKISPRVPQLLHVAVLPWALLALLYFRRLLPARDSEAGRFLLCTFLVAVAVFPVGLVAVFKVGGEAHLVHSWLYLSPALVLAWLARDPPASVSALVVVGLALALHASEFASLPARPLTARLAFAERLARANPGRLWFPQNPLVTFYADQKLYHAEDGIATRHLAGYGLREPDFRRHLPAQLHAVVYATGTRDTFARNLLLDYNTPTTQGAWTLYLRAP